MDEIKYIIGKIDAMDSKLDAVVVTQAVQTEQLTEHMRRTELAELNHNLLIEKFEPVKKTVDNWKFLVKVSLALLGVSGALIAILKFVLKVL